MQMKFKNSREVCFRQYSFKIMVFNFDLSIRLFRYWKKSMPSVGFMTEIVGNITYLGDKQKA